MILLDSHALVWFLTGDNRCSPTARESVETADRVLVSAASAWEIATKVRAGKWAAASDIIAQLTDVLAENGLRGLAVSVEHGRLAGSLPGAHRDPFDRMLAAQAILEGVPLVTADPAFRAFGVRTIW